jgi:hypothetical protein
MNLNEAELHLSEFRKCLDRVALTRTRLVSYRENGLVVKPDTCLVKSWVPRLGDTVAELLDPRKRITVPVYCFEVNNWNLERYTGDNAIAWGFVYPNSEGMVQKDFTFVLESNHANYRIFLGQRCERAIVSKEFAGVLAYRGSNIRRQQSDMLRGKLDVILRNGDENQRNWSRKDRRFG